VCVDIPGSTTDLGEGEHDAPHLTLVAETKLADELQFSVPERIMLIKGTNDLGREPAHAQWSEIVVSYKRADSKGCVRSGQQNWVLALLLWMKLCEKQDVHDEGPCSCIELASNFSNRFDDIRSYVLEYDC